MALAVLLTAAAVFGWARGWPAAADAPAAALGVAVGLYARVATGGRDVARWKRGAEGEQRTADILAALPSRRWTVWHDLRVPGSRSNIDHLVVGRTGIWVLDSKATRGDVRARRRSVRFGDRRLDTSAVTWEAEVVHSVLADSESVRGQDVEPEPAPTVRPLVVVHGAWAGRGRAKVAGVRVVPASGLLRELTRGRRRLRRADVLAAGRVLDLAFSTRTRRVGGGRVL
jgi:hypothetical protein